LKCAAGIVPATFIANLLLTESTDMHHACNEWLSGQTIQLSGISVEISRPRLLARSRDYLWFPTFARRGDGVIVALAQQYPDVSGWPVPQWAFFSFDGGLTWPERVLLPSSAEVFVHLADGDLALMPYYLVKEGDSQVAEGYLLRQGTTRIDPLPRMVRVTGWPFECLCIPKPADASDREKRLGTIFTGQTVRTGGGGHLAALYTVTSLKPRRYGVVVAESADAMDWHIRATVAIPGRLPDGGYVGNEGANEATLARVADGRLLCVYRAGGWNPCEPFGHAWSSDDGRTWDAGRPMPAGDSFIAPMSVQPSLVSMPDGTLLLAGGRPGMRFWIDVSGTAQGWQHIDLQLHHTWCVPDEPILNTDHHARKQSTSYTELLALDDRHLLMVYDRTPHGWNRIPAGVDDTNSLWVVRLTLTRMQESSRA
jgi:hypothetical protein